MRRTVQLAVILVLAPLISAGCCSLADAGAFALNVAADSLGHEYQTAAPPGTPAHARYSSFGTEGDARSRRQRTTSDGY